MYYHHQCVLIISMLAAVTLAACGGDGADEPRPDSSAAGANVDSSSQQPVLPRDTSARIDTALPLRPDTNRIFMSDTTVTFTLRWATKRTDLDLMMIRPAGDTIGWWNRRIGQDNLDNDDNNGEGPEDIVFHAPLGVPGNVVRLMVFYNGPSGGADTKATVFGQVKHGPSVRLGTCVLKPGELWPVGWFDPVRLQDSIRRDSTCRRMPSSDLPRKNIISPGG